MSDVEFGLFHIAATLGCTVAALSKTLTYREFGKWMQYFTRLNEPSGKATTGPNLLDDPEAMIRAAEAFK